MEGIEKQIENIKEALESENLRNKRGNNYYILKHHRSGDVENCKIRSFSEVSRRELEQEKHDLQRFNNSLEEMTREDLENWLEGLEIVKTQFTKRLNTYLKRY